MNKLKKIIKRIIMATKVKKIEPITNVVDNEQLLKDKIALITGGSGGIGFAIAKTFIESGCKVIISGTNEQKLKENSNKLGENCKYIKINLTNVSEIKDKVQEASNIFGDINILVNSAGTHTDRKDLDFLNITEQEYDSVMNLNMKGTYFMCQEFANSLISKKVKGHIIIIGSELALESSWSPYRLSKYCIKGLTQGMAKKLLPYGIIVNAISPGLVATAMQPYEEGDSIYTRENPIGRYIMPSEVAMYARMLASDLGDTIVGNTIYMSGGRGII